MNETAIRPIPLFSAFSAGIRVILLLGAATLFSISAIAIADQMGSREILIPQKGNLMAERIPKEQDILKLRQFVEKMGSLEKAKAALDALQKVRKAA